MFNQKNNEDRALHIIRLSHTLEDIIHDNRSQPHNVIVTRLLAGAYLNFIEYKDAASYLLLDKDYTYELDWNYIIDNILAYTRGAFVNYHHEIHDSSDRLLNVIRSSTDLCNIVFNSATGEDLITNIDKELVTKCKEALKHSNNETLERVDVVQKELLNINKDLLDVAESLYRYPTLANMVINAVHESTINNAIAEAPKPKSEYKVSPLKQLSKKRVQYDVDYKDYPPDIKHIIREEFSDNLLLNIYEYFDKNAELMVNKNTKECALITYANDELNHKFNYSKNIFSGFKEMLNTILVNMNYNYGALYNYYCKDGYSYSNGNSITNLRNNILQNSFDNTGATLSLYELGFIKIALKDIICSKTC